MNTIQRTALIAGCMIGAGYSALFIADQEAVPRVTALCDAPRTSAPQVRADAAFVADVTTGAILYEKHAEAQLPLASLTKLMTVVTALEALGPTFEVRITEDALTPEGDSGLRVGEQWRVDDLARYVLITSSNDGAHALGLSVENTLNLGPGGFVELMNRRARLLGLSQTFFLGDTGLDVSETTASAYGSAHDAAKLLAHAATVAPALIERSVAPAWRFVSSNGIVHSAENTTLLASLYPSAIGSKTGFTDLAGGNLVLMFEPIPGRQAVLAVLGSTRDGRELDMAELARYTTAEVRRRASCEEIW